MKKKILFLTGTRADFGKLKSLINITTNDDQFEVIILVTGMHLSQIHGCTIEEIEKSGYKNIERFDNSTFENTMDLTLAKTICGVSEIINNKKPDLIVIHGDRVEALAGAISGALNNMLVAHIEGGEVSGTIDELIRHSVSKMSHAHFVSNFEAKKRLVQMGEIDDTIFEIGSPDVDAMLSQKLPTIDDVKLRYDIDFVDYGIVLFHPVTTEDELLNVYAKNLVDALIESQRNYVVIYPNNDLGSSKILNEYKRLLSNPRFKLYPSLRFEYFLVLLKYAKCIVGNSSAGIREAPYYGISSVNIGTRQQNRALFDQILNCTYETVEITKMINVAFNTKFEPLSLYGDGSSDAKFIEVIKNQSFWHINKQKQFKDL